MRNASRVLVPLAAIIGAGLGFVFTSELPDRGCGKPWIFFDLGNTLIVASPNEASRYIDGAHEYLRELRRRGYPIGLITNIPEKWGRNRAEKLHVLKRMVDQTWTREAGAEAMDWSDFPESAIVLPPRDALRKPAPYLFQAALEEVTANTGKRGCPAIFQGEDPVEVDAAKRAGMKGFIVGENPEMPYLAIDRLDHYD